MILNAKSLLSVICVLLSGFHSYAFQSADDAPAAIEKTWLFTDDYIYKAGEHVWFKVLSRNLENHQLSAVAYVSLIDKSGNQILQQRIMADEGFASGMLKLPDTLSDANYALVAHTRYGLSKSPEFIASQLLKVKGNSNEALSETGKILPKLFFEGGNVVHGRNKVLVISDGPQSPVEAYLIGENNEKQEISLARDGQGYQFFEMVIKKTAACQLLLIHNEQEVLLQIPEPEDEALALQLSRLDERELRFKLEGDARNYPFSLIISSDGKQIEARTIKAGEKQIAFDCSNWREGKYKAEILTGAGQLKSYRYFYLGATGDQPKSKAGKINPRQNFSVKGQFYSRTETSQILAFVTPATHSLHKMSRFISSNLLLQNLLLTYPDIDINDALIVEKPAGSPSEKNLWKELNIFTHAFESYKPEFPESLGLADLGYSFWNEEEAEWLREKTLLDNLLAFYYPKQRSYFPAALNADKTYWPEEYEDIYSMIDLFKHIAYEIKVSASANGEVNLALRYLKGERSYTYNEEPMYVIDGYIVDKKAVLEMSLEKVEYVSLIRQQRSIDKTEIGPPSYNGIISLQTKKGDYAKIHYLPVEQRLYKDLDLPYTFTNNPFKIRTDNRSTPFFHFPIYWQPDLVLLQNNRFRLQFRHTDSLGDFNIVLIGIDKHNKVQAEVITYSVGL